MKFCFAGTQIFLVLALAACQAETVDRDAAGTPAISAEPRYASRTIAQVQGKSAISPLLDQHVKVRGVVSANFVRGLEGFFVQSETPDKHRSTSDALFVRHGRENDPEIRLGMLVEVSGQVVELGEQDASLTAIAPARIEALGNAPLPNPVLLNSAPARTESWEPLEGMRVQIVSPLTVTGNSTLERYGELITSFDGRLFVPTDVVGPGVEARRLAQENARRRIILDDNRTQQNPPDIWYLPQPLNDDHPYRVGTVLEQVQGVVDQRFGQYRIQLTEPIQKITQAPRPAAPSRDAGDIRLVNLNMLNLFNGDGQSGGFPTERGAADFAAFQRQLNKHVALITALDPDILALQEVENDSDEPYSALQSLIDALNAGVRGSPWQSINLPSKPGTDEISVALIFRADRVSAAGNAALLLGGVFDGKSRPPITQSFRSKRGSVFTVSVNHFKSKGSCGDAVGADQDQGDGQGCFNATRLESAQKLTEWLSSDPTGSNSDLRLVVGDLNAYAQEDPVLWFRQHGWRDAFSVHSDAYSYVYNGEAGRLDHVLVSHAAYRAVKRAQKWHVNADEALSFEYARSQSVGPWRSSDHDPLIVDLDL